MNAQSLHSYLSIGEGNPAPFEGDAEGITFLKAQFLAAANKFFYLRKGEDINAHLIAALYGHSIGFDWDKIPNEEVRKDAKELTKTVLSKPWVRRLQFTGQKIHHHKIICIPDPDPERAAPINKALGVDVMFIPAEYKHLYRLYLNERAFAFFYRHGEGEAPMFRGHIGESDTQVIDGWKEAFEAEWELWARIGGNSVT